MEIHKKLLFDGLVRTRSVLATLISIRIRYLLHFFICLKLFYSLEIMDTGYPFHRLKGFLKPLHVDGLRDGIYRKPETLRKQAPATHAMASPTLSAIPSLKAVLSDELSMLCS